MGTLLNKALLLGNSSNSTRQYGGGYYSEWASAPFTLIRIITREPRAPSPRYQRRATWGAFQDDTEKNARAGR